MKSIKMIMLLLLVGTLLLGINITQAQITDLSNDLSNDFTNKIFLDNKIIIFNDSNKDIRINYTILNITSNNIDKTILSEKQVNYKVSDTKVYGFTKIENLSSTVNELNNSIIHLTSTVIFPRDISKEILTKEIRIEKNYFIPRFWCEINDDNNGLFAKIIKNELIDKYTIKYDLQIDFGKESNFQALNWSNFNIKNFNITCYDPVVSTNHTIFFPMNSTNPEPPRDYAPDSNNNSITTWQNYYSYVTDIDGVIRVESNNSCNDPFMINQQTGAILTPNNDFTLCLVTRPKTSGTEEALTFIGSDDITWYRKTDGRVEFQLAGSYYTFATTMPINELNHYCVVFDTVANTFTLYKNATTIETKTGVTANPSFASGTNWPLLCRGGYNRCYSGLTNNFRWWNGYALSSSEIADVFNTDLNVSLGAQTITCTGEIFCNQAYCYDAATTFQCDNTGSSDSEYCNQNTCI